MLRTYPLVIYFLLKPLILSFKLLLSQIKRILSKRTDAGVGWELVAPSFYTGAVSLYAGNEQQQPGHIDYGRSRLPNNAWMCVGVTVDRENFGKDMAHVVPFVNGFSDGPGMR